MVIAFHLRDGAFHHRGGHQDAPVLVYELAPRKALGFGKGNVYSQTRWRF